MDFSEAKEQFISTWGELGCSWGICRTMGQIHALLLISPTPVCADQIKEELDISGGNANMNLRALVDWGIVYRRSIPGERKDYYVAEKDFWSVFKKVLLKRKKQELNPMIELTRNLSDTKVSCEQSREFIRVIDNINVISTAADKSLDKLLSCESNLLLNTVVRVMR
ncbi:MAG: transcriptional regulator [Bacteroidia bacterium]|nr:transcriptional regulator [Bacteroidia bacterium]MBT8229077.1 transcriptional regulator [Bacteroidia bacterium]NNK89909.1 transcriptional regulator [Saprospiraceae bacterium]